jgi:hypothetical protein
VQALPLVVILALFATGCAPNERQLYGFWANLEGAVWRVLQFAETQDSAHSEEFQNQDCMDEPDLMGLNNVYCIYSYEVGDDPSVVQRGLFNVRQGAVVWDVTADIDPELLGQVFANEILEYSGRVLVLGSDAAPDGQRVYQRVPVPP